MLMQIILVKLTLYLSEKCQKKIREKFHRFIPWQNPIKVSKIPPKSNSVNPVPAESTAVPCPTIIGPLLRFYNNVATV